MSDEKGVWRGSEAAIAERNRRIQIIQPLVTEGLGPSQISHRTGLNTKTISHIIRRYCVRPEGYIKKVSVFMTQMDWQSEVDASHLSKDQREHASRLGLTEGRYAWLMTCSRGMHFELQNKKTNG